MIESIFIKVIGPPHASSKIGGLGAVTAVCAKKAASVLHAIWHIVASTDDLTLPSRLSIYNELTKILVVEGKLLTDDTTMK